LDKDVAIAVRLITRNKSTRVVRFAFEEARKRGWSHIVAISKANILKVTDGLFLECARRVARKYPRIELEDLFIDNFAQQLVKNPDRFNRSIIVGTNLFMDVLSEEASGLIGSIGMVYSGNSGRLRHVRASPRQHPKYKGLNKVNPTATILSAAWMLDYLGEKGPSKAIFDATLKVIAAGRISPTTWVGRLGRARWLAPSPGSSSLVVLPRVP